MFSEIIEWKKTDDGEYPYQAKVSGQVYKIRVNDWPEHPTVYSLIDPNGVATDFDDWPEPWYRSEASKSEELPESGASVIPEVSSKPTESPKKLRDGPRARKLLIIVILELFLLFDLSLLVNKTESANVADCEVELAYVTHRLYCDGIELGITQHPEQGASKIARVKYTDNYIYQVILEIDGNKDTSLFAYVMLYVGLLLFLPLLIWFVKFSTIARLLFR